MNKTLLITYDRGKSTTDPPGLVEAIKSYNTWARLRNGVYIIVANGTPETVRDQLKLYLRPGDNLYVGVVGAPAAWHNLSDSLSNWLRNNLK